jgi:hypothetical protein
MKLHPKHPQSGSTLICAMCTLLIIALLGANVLMNCTARYNTVSKQIKGWKEALYAAEAGGDVAFNEIRKNISGIIPGAGTPFSATGWTTVDSTHWSYAALPSAIGDSGNLNASVTVERIMSTASGDGVFRVRSAGTAQVFGLSRAGLNDGTTGLVNFAATGRTRGDGDSLVRKIDLHSDHFVSTYGDGDLHNLGVGATVTTPKVTRRVELIVVPIMPINGAVKALVGYDGNGADSYDSKNGPYPGSSNPAGLSPYTGLPYINDAHNGNVAVNSAVFNANYIWGDLSTNGGNATSANASGVIDNNAPINIAPYALPTHPAYQAVQPASFTPLPASDWASSPWYHYTGNLSNLNVANPSGTAETYVNIVVDGDVTNSLTIAQGVNVRIHFAGNFSMKAGNVNNNNVDGTFGGIVSSRAGHLQLRGISPTDGSTQSMNISPPGALYAAIYAPSANFSLNGNPDLYGAIVCASWSGNGNTFFHFDKELAEKVSGVDYRVASYIEDVR